MTELIVAIICGIIIGPLGVALIIKCVKEDDWYGLWTGVFAFSVGLLLVTITLRDYFNEPIELIEHEPYGGFYEYDFGEVGIIAFQDSKSEVTVVSCFQSEEETVTVCWDRKFKKDE